MSDADRPQEVMFLARGELRPNEFQVILQILGGVGISTKVILPDEFNDILSCSTDDSGSSAKLILPPLEAITSSDDFLVREHFDEFREKAAPDISPKSIGHLFSNLVDRPKPRRQPTNPNTPPDPYPGIIIKGRHEAALPAYAGTSNRSANILRLSKYAIEAGSLIGVAKRLQYSHEQEAIRRSAPRLIRLALHLESQLGN